MDEFEFIKKLETDNEVMKYIGSGARTPEEIKDGIQKSILHFEKFGYSVCSIYEKSEGIFIGRGGLFHFAWNDKNDEIELGYRLLKQFFGVWVCNRIIKIIFRFCI